MSECPPLSFAVPGRPRTKQRPRVVVNNGRAHAYTPADTATYERVVRGHAGIAAAKHGRWNATGRMYMRLVVYQANARRADLDNFWKAVSDALIGVVYEDDSQIDEAYVRREIDREHPRIEVEVGHLAEVVR